MTDPEKMTKRFLVRFLAVEVMGPEFYNKITEKTCDNCQNHNVTGCFSCAVGEEFGLKTFELFELRNDVFDPIVSFADHDILVGAMAKRGWRWYSCYLTDEDQILVTFFKDCLSIEAYADTLSKATCIAAAKAILAEKD